MPGRLACLGAITELTGFRVDWRLSALHSKKEEPGQREPGGIFRNGAEDPLSGKRPKVPGRYRSDGRCGRAGAEVAEHRENPPVTRVTGVQAELGEDRVDVLAHGAVGDDQGGG